MKKMLRALCVVLLVPVMCLVLVGCGDVGNGDTEGKSTEAKLPDKFKGRGENAEDIIVNNLGDGEFEFVLPTATIKKEIVELSNPNHSQCTTTDSPGYTLKGKVTKENGQLKGVVYPISETIVVTDYIEHKNKSQVYKTSVDTFTYTPTGADGEVYIQQNGEYAFDIPSKLVNRSEILTGEDKGFVYDTEVKDVLRVRLTPAQ